MKRVLLAMALLLSACSLASDEERLVEAMSRSKSWAAALAYRAELWASNRIPTAIVKDSIQSARAEEANARKRLERSSAEESLRRRLRQDLDVMERSLQSLAEAISSRDRDAVLATTENLRGVGSDLEAARAERGK